MPTPIKNVIGEDPKADSLIRGEWRDFSKTLAYKEMMQYMEVTGDRLITDATEGTITINGEKHPITGEYMNFLLQRRAGIDIIKTYIRLFSE